MNLKTAWLAIIAMAFLLRAETNAPIAFTLNDLDGKPVSFADYAGRVVVIDFWATWCQSCKEAFPKLNRLHSEFGPRGVTVIGINVEHMKPEKISAFVDKAEIDYKVLLDPKAETVKQFGIKGVPSLVVVSSDGRIKQIFRGIDKETESQVTDLLTAMTQKK